MAETRNLRIKFAIVVVTLVTFLIIMAVAPLRRAAANVLGAVGNAFSQLPGISWVLQQGEASATPADGAAADQSGDSSAVDSILEAGQQLQKEGSLQEALKRYREALKLDERYAPTRLSLASLYLQLGQEKEALGELKQAAELAPDNAFVQSQLGQLHFRLENWEESVVALERARSLDPKDAQAPYFLGLAYYYRSHQDARKAVENLEQAAKLEPNEAEVHFRLAMVYTNRDDEGDLGRATAALEKVIALDPARLEAYYFLGQFYMRANKPDAAGVVWRQFVARSDDKEKVAQVREWLGNIGK